MDSNNALLNEITGLHTARMRLAEESEKRIREIESIDKRRVTKRLQMIDTDRRSESDFWSRFTDEELDEMFRLKCTIEVMRNNKLFFDYLEHQFIKE